MACKGHWFGENDCFCSLTIYERIAVFVLFHVVLMAVSAFLKQGREVKVYRQAIVFYLWMIFLFMPLLWTNTGIAGDDLKSARGADCEEEQAADRLVHLFCVYHRIDDCLRLYSVGCVKLKTADDLSFYVLSDEQRDERFATCQQMILKESRLFTKYQQMIPKEHRFAAEPVNRDAVCFVALPCRADTWVNRMRLARGGGKTLGSIIYWNFVEKSVKPVLTEFEASDLETSTTATRRVRKEISRYSRWTR